MDESNICDRKAMRVEDKTNVVSLSVLAVAPGVTQEVLGVSSRKAVQGMWPSSSDSGTDVGVPRHCQAPCLACGRWWWWSGQMAPWGRRPMKGTDRMTHVHILFLTLGHNFGSI